MNIYYDDFGKTPILTILNKIIEFIIGMTLTMAFINLIKLIPFMPQNLWIYSSINHMELLGAIIGFLLASITAIFSKFKLGYSICTIILLSYLLISSVKEKSILAIIIYSIFNIVQIIITIKTFNLLQIKKKLKKLQKEEQKKYIEDYKIKEESERNYTTTKSLMENTFDLLIQQKLTPNYKQQYDYLLKRYEYFKFKSYSDLKNQEEANEFCKISTSLLRLAKDVESSNEIN